MDGSGMGRNLLDPGATEFYPASQFATIYYPAYGPPMAYPPPPSHPLQLHHNALPNDGEPTRCVLLTLLPGHIDDASVSAAMEAFGSVQAVDTPSEAGSTIVHFHDLRCAAAAVYEIREQHVRHQSLLARQFGVVPANWAVSPVVAPCRGLVAGHPVWAQFRAPDGPARLAGSLVVHNCDPAVPSAFLADLFASVGDVKEVKEMAGCSHRRLVEFYDVRDAARAASEISGKEVYGRRLVIEVAGNRARYQRRPTGGGHQHHQRLGLSMAGRWVEAQLPSPASSSSDQRGKFSRERGKAAAVRQETASSSSSSSSSSATVAGVMKQQQQQLSSRRSGWKYHHHSRNNLGGDSRFQFKDAPPPPPPVEATTDVGASPPTEYQQCRDSRTTVMIKNIPNKYSQMLLLKMLDDHCVRCNEENATEDEPLSAYDFVYLPIDFNNKCNVGYGFVNLTSPEAAVRLHRTFHMQPWEVFNSRKICQVNYARLQGLEALKEHFKNSKFACDTDEYMPVVFCPPRDGKHRTEPVPVGGMTRRGGMHSGRSSGGGDPEASLPHPTTEGGGASSTTASTHAPSDTADGAEEDDDRYDDDEEEETASLLSQALHLPPYASSSSDQG